MNKDVLIAKLEEGTSTLRTVLRQHDGSTIKVLSETIRQGVDNLKTAFSQNETAQKAITEMKKYYDELGTAVERGDKELTDKLLTSIEKKLAEYKAKKN